MVSVERGGGSELPSSDNWMGSLRNLVEEAARETTSPAAREESRLAAVGARTLPAGKRASFAELIELGKAAEAAESSPELGAIGSLAWSNFLARIAQGRTTYADTLRLTEWLKMAEEVLTVARDYLVAEANREAAAGFLAAMAKSTPQAMAGPEERIPWEAAPPWAHWYAQNADSTAIWFEHKPTAFEKIGRWDWATKNTLRAPAPYISGFPNWKESLRPCAQRRDPTLTENGGEAKR